MGSKTKNVTNINKEAFFDQKKMRSYLRQPMTHAEAINKLVDKEEFMKLSNKLELLFQMLAGTWLYLKDSDKIDLNILEKNIVEFRGLHNKFTEVMKVQQSEMITNKTEKLDDNKVLEGCRTAGIPDDVISVIFGIKEVPVKKEDEAKAKVDEQFPTSAKLTKEKDDGQRPVTKEVESNILNMINKDLDEQVVTVKDNEKTKSKE